VCVTRSLSSLADLQAVRPDAWRHLPSTSVRLIQRFHACNDAGYGVHAWQARHSTRHVALAWRHTAARPPPVHPATRGTCRATPSGGDGAAYQEQQQATKGALDLPLESQQQQQQRGQPVGRPDLATGGRPVHGGSQLVLGGRACKHAHAPGRTAKHFQRSAGGQRVAPAPPLFGRAQWRRHAGWAAELGHLPAAAASAAAAPCSSSC
jgi:hypothetical protein